MNLIDVYRDVERSRHLLYALLLEREAHESISHRIMPGWNEHCEFIDSKPYEAWYLIYEDIQVPDFGVEHMPIGATYLTKNREIGIGILKADRRMGHAEWAIKELMRRHPGKFLANIAPRNEKSILLFEKLGFRLIQNTYEKT